MTTKPHNNGRSEIFDATCDNVSVGAVSTQISLGISRSTLKPTEPRYRCFSRRIMRSNMEIKVYGMIEAFDSHNGIERFIEKELISRLLPNDRTGVHVLDKNPSDGQIISLLNETFQNIDHEYFRRFIGSPLAERCSQLMYPGASLEPMNDKVDGGATAMVVLIHGNRLFTANLGDSRAIMVQKKKGSDALTATQITTWHDPKDPEERDRLIRLEIKPSDVIAPTRCFGDVFRKEGALSCAIIAEPSVHGPIVIGKAARFLILVNAETVTLLNDLNKNENVNRTIASIFADKLMETNCDLGVRYFINHKQSDSILPAKSSFSETDQDDYHWTMQWRVADMITSKNAKTKFEDCDKM
ncbi:hypothetical protein AB6A40_002284 [Gnathostoma spinigerum]|uniref:protein-serine/threonine phosphatase n=1 Tax=Gnathostoma spinigerum TaxID=75299 RepID=A0ABD6E662_9BILA